MTHGSVVSQSFAQYLVMIWLLIMLSMELEVQASENVDDMIGFRKMQDDQESKYLAGLREEGWLWPGGVVPYTIDVNFSQRFRNRIAKAMNAIESVSCIRFEPYDPKRHEEKVNIQRMRQKCESTVGIINKTNDQLHVDLDEKLCHVGTVIHELMHTLGFEHEHSRMDRDSSIRVNFDNVKKDEIRNFNISHYTKSITPYDYGSIMHYGPTSFTKNGRPTIEAKSPLSGVELGQRKQLSTYDIVQINRYYHCFESDECQDKLQDCDKLSMEKRYCDKSNVAEIRDTCMRTCGMCRYKNKRRKERRRSTELSS